VQTILQRLISQLEASGMAKPQAVAIATSQLQKSGSLRPGTQTLTSKGKTRSAMGAAGRATDRAAKRSGGSASDYTYNQMTNSARKKFSGPVLARRLGKNKTSRKG
jgi:hypothetical protein